MNISDIEKVFTVMIQKKFRGTSMIWGRHGLGKSSVLRQIGKKVGYRVLDLRLSQKEAIDLTGMLFTFSDPELNMSVTANHPPKWFADALKNGKVILFLDEFNMARREVMNAAFELILDRKLNDVALPDDVFIVCAGNPEDERYDGLTPMSESLIDRLLHIKATPDVDGWLSYAESAKCDPRIVSFIRANPTALFHPNKLDDNFPVKIKHSERTWLDRANPILQLGLDQELQYELLCGAVGAEMALLFSKTIEKENMPITVKEIFSGTKDVLDRASRYRAGMRQDLLSISITELVNFAEKNPIESTKHLDQIMTFINRLPDEGAMVVIQGTRKIEGWAKEYLKDTEIAKKLNTISEVVQQVKKAKGKS